MFKYAERHFVFRVGVREECSPSHSIGFIVATVLAPCVFQLWIYITRMYTLFKEICAGSSLARVVKKSYIFWRGEESHVKIATVLYVTAATLATGTNTSSGHYYKTDGLTQTGRKSFTHLPLSDLNPGTAPVSVLQARYLFPQKWGNRYLLHDNSYMITLTW